MLGKVHQALPSPRWALDLPDPAMRGARGHGSQEAYCLAGFTLSELSPKSQELVEKQTQSPRPRISQGPAELFSSTTSDLPRTAFTPTARRCWPGSDCCLSCFQVKACSAHSTQGQIMSVPWMIRKPDLKARHLKTQHLREGRSGDRQGTVFPPLLVSLLKQG